VHPWGYDVKIPLLLFGPPQAYLISFFNLAYMKELRVPLPSLDERQTIASLLMNVKGKLEAGS